MILYKTRIFFNLEYRSGDAFVLETLFMITLRFAQNYFISTVYYFNVPIRPRKSV